MTIERRLEGGFFIREWSSNESIIRIIVKIPSFDEFCAFTGCFGEEIDEDHG